MLLWFYQPKSAGNTKEMPSSQSVLILFTAQTSSVSRYSTPAYIMSIFYFILFYLLLQPLTHKKTLTEDPVGQGLCQVLAVFSSSPASVLLCCAMQHVEN